MNAILAWIGPALIRALSSTAAKAVGIAVMRYALDAAQRRLLAAGHADAARLLQDVEAELFDDPTPLVRAVEGAILAAPTVTTRA